MTDASTHIVAGRRGAVADLALSRPEALNSLDLTMVRQIHRWLLDWSADPAVQLVLIHGVGRSGKAPAFCAGGDIRFFHRAALAGDPSLEDFFTEEYALNFLIHNYTKPIVAIMDGIVFGGGMGLAQGAALRVVTERSHLGMPETQIGLFPDVGGGWFLSRCPGSAGEYLGVVGPSCAAGDALELGLADLYVSSDALPGFVDQLLGVKSVDELAEIAASFESRPRPGATLPLDLIDRHFAKPSLAAIAASLATDSHPFAVSALAEIGRRSPLMMVVTLEQIRRARTLPLRECLMMERDLVRNCFHIRSGTGSETVEGIRALVIDKDRAPRWKPQQIDQVTTAMVAAYFASPWPTHAHPLRYLNPVANRYDRERLFGRAEKALSD